MDVEELKNMNGMLVSDLIALLQTFPQDLPVAYRRYSEQCLLEKSQLCVTEDCSPRPDGWIQHARPDMPKIKYLMFPGN